MWTIEVARMVDVPELQRVLERSVRQLGGADYDPRQIDTSLQRLFGIDTTLIQDRSYFAVRSEGRIIACGGWSFRRTLYGGEQFSQRDSEMLDPAREPARIRAMYVDPAWARRGIGAAILDHSERAAAAAGFLEMELMSTLTGIPLYVKAGYRAVEDVSLTLEGDVPFPLVRMRKPLESRPPPIPEL